MRTSVLALRPVRSSVSPAGTDIELMTIEVQAFLLAAVTWEKVVKVHAAVAAEAGSVDSALAAEEAAEAFELRSDKDIDAAVDTVDFAEVAWMDDVGRVLALVGEGVVSVVFVFVFGFVLLLFFVFEDFADDVVEAASAAAVIDAAAATPLEEILGNETEL
jgi:hypothetical protein